MMTQEQARMVVELIQGTAQYWHDVNLRCCDMEPLAAKLRELEQQLVDSAIPEATDRRFHQAVVRHIQYGGTS